MDFLKSKCCFNWKVTGIVVGVVGIASSIGFAAFFSVIFLMVGDLIDILIALSALSKLHFEWLKKKSKEKLLNESRFSVCSRKCVFAAELVLAEVNLIGKSLGPFFMHETLTMKHSSSLSSNNRWITCIIHLLPLRRLALCAKCWRCSALWIKLQPVACAISWSGIARMHST